MPRFWGGGLNLSSLARLEESRSSVILSLYLFSQGRMRWTVPSWYPCSRKHLLSNCYVPGAVFYTEES